MRDSGRHGSSLRRASGKALAPPPPPVPTRLPLATPPVVKVLTSHRVDWEEHRRAGLACRPGVRDVLHARKALAREEKKKGTRGGKEGPPAPLLRKGPVRPLRRCPLLRDLFSDALSPQVWVGREERRGPPPRGGRELEPPRKAKSIRPFSGTGPVPPSFHSPPPARPSSPRGHCPERGRACPRARLGGGVRARRAGAGRARGAGGRGVGGSSTPEPPPKWGPSNFCPHSTRTLPPPQVGVVSHTTTHTVR